MRRLFSLVAASMLLVLSGAAVLAQPADPDPECDYYEETGHNLCEPFQSYWMNNGGLPVFGYPKTEAENELNIDLNQEFPTQYFERERMEHHSENAGTAYEILLGRLGNEVLLEMDRDWMSFPTADPSAEHYFAETGHAIGAEFWGYWSSHGLDLGDDDISFAESLALFGFPISEPEMETNSSGDTVLTQWFERARFEYHPNNEPEFQVLLGLLGNEILEYRDGGSEPPPPPEGVGEVIADGLTNPRGIAIGDDGMIYAIDSGMPTDDCFSAPPPGGGDDVEVCYGYTSSVIAINPEDGSTSTVISALPEVTAGGEGGTVQDIVLGEDGTIYGIIGLGGNPADRESTFGDFGNDLGWVFMSDGAGSWTKVLDIAAWEGMENPDGGDPAEGGIDSNPYSLTMDSMGGWVVSDAGGNDLIHVDSEGNLSTLAVFEDQMVDAPPFLGLPDGAQVPMQAVPTGVVTGPDGAFYVGELTGFPFAPGTAHVWRVTADGEATVYADGFTNVIDLAFDGAGNLYVLEMVAGGLLSADPSDPPSAAAQIIMVAPDGTQSEVDSAGLIFATGIAIGHDGTIYVSNFGVMPMMGQIVAISDVAEPFPTGPEMTVVAEGLNSPRGIDVDADGNVYVAEAGTGGDDCITMPGGEGEEDFDICFGTTGQVTMVDAEGNQSVAFSGLTSLDIGGGEVVGAQDVAVVGDELYVIMGLGADPAERAGVGETAGDLGWLISGPAGGDTERDVDVAAYEGVENPDGGDPEDGGIDSNPYSTVMSSDGDIVVSDAGANALLHIDDEGEVSTLAVFEPRMVDAPPFLGLPDGAQIPMQAVPTGVVEGPDGAFYVGELTGFPFANGMARVWRVTHDGEASVYAEGFTNVIDLAFDSEGNLYVLEMVAGGLLNVNEEDPSTAAARIVKVEADGSQTDLGVNGLVFATGLAIDANDTVYVSNFGVMPGMGQVVSFSLE